MSLELRYVAKDMALGEARTLPLGELGTIMIGSLASNQLALGGPGVEPIHCMIERQDGGAWRIVDLGTLTGVRVNGTLIDVEADVKAGDTIEIGSAKLTLSELRTPTVRKDPPPKAKATISSLASRALFNPRSPTSKGGRRLEVVAYWGNTVLNVDQFHPDEKGFDAVTIGDPTKAHFISGGREFFNSEVLADVEDGRCVLRLVDEMKAQVRKDGELTKIKGTKKISLGPRDFAHVEYGPVRYFLHYANQPQVELPKTTVKDALFVGLSTFMAVAYVILVALALTIDPKTQEEPFTPWQPVPEDPDQRPVKEAKKPDEPKKPEIKIVEIKIDPPKKAQPPKKDPIKPIPPVKAEAKPPKKPDPVKTEPKKPDPVQQVAQPKMDPKPEAKAPSALPTPSKDPSPVAAKPNPAPPSPTPSLKPSLTPKFNLAQAGNAGPAGDKRPGLKGNNGGPGMKSPAIGAPMKGTQGFDNPGVDGGKLNKPSFLNLKQLGAGKGKVSSLTGAGALSVDFKDSSGGMGKKAGSNLGGYNLGGAGGGKLLAIQGNGGEGWGKGPGGMLGGGKGPGGNGTDLAGVFGGTGPGGGPHKPGTGPGGGGHGRANVEVPALPGAQGGGLRPDEIMQVIRSHLNQIRHCYEQTLQRSPNKAGQMKVSFVINPAGRVTTVTLGADTVGDAVMRGCVTGKIARWAFPQPRNKQNVTVNYPFSFAPIGG